MATEGGYSPTAPDPADADVVITTVVSADDPRPPTSAPRAPADNDDDLDWIWADSEEGADDLGPPQPAPAVSQAEPEPAPEPAPEPEPAPVAALPPPPPPPPPPANTLEQRLAALQALPATVENLAKNIRHELERCAGVLFGHDRALGALAGRLDSVEAAVTPAIDLSEPGPPIEERVVAQLEDMNRRLAAMEARVEPLEPLPTVVQALRRAVRAGDDLIVGETGAREQALASLAGQQAAEAQARDDALRRLLAQDLDRVTGISQAQAKGLSDLAERVASAETRLAPLEPLPEDVAALSRILRRELDAIVSDNSARDQMLRRALQNEIDQLRATSEAREALAQALSGRLDAVEDRTADATSATETALGAAGGRLDILETRADALDKVGIELESLRAAVAKELEALQASARAHDQVAGELTRRVSALDSRLARLDPVPGEVQSLRTAILQEAERTMASLRATDERISQLAWVPGEFQEARKRIMSLTSGMQSGEDQIRLLEAAVGSINERLDGLRTRLGASNPPGPQG